MRRLALSLLALGAMLSVAQAQTVPPRIQTPTHLPAPVAEPENNAAYAPPTPVESVPSSADIGPAQRNFVMVSAPDNLVAGDEYDNASLNIHEKKALDKEIKIPVIHDVQNDPTYKGGDNKALEFETKYLNWGAVTEAQLRARRGHYFTITWDNDGPDADFTTRFEYRQVLSKEITRSMTQKVKQASGATRSYFAVVNKAYLAYGPVCSWRFTVLKGDTIVAEAKSFIW